MIPAIAGYEFLLLTLNEKTHQNEVKSPIPIISLILKAILYSIGRIMVFVVINLHEEIMSLFNINKETSLSSGHNSYV
jgi:hypothetical protein